jgi:hypothetical protein
MDSSPLTFLQTQATQLFFSLPISAGEVCKPAASNAHGHRAVRAPEAACTIPRTDGHPCVPQNAEYRSAFLQSGGGCTVLPSVRGISPDRRPDPSERTRRRGTEGRRPVIISQDGKPVAPLINIDDLADLEDRAALAAHLADKAAGRDGISLDELDAALDRIEAGTRP